MRAEPLPGLVGPLLAALLTLSCAGGKVKDPPPAGSAASAASSAAGPRREHGGSRDWPTFLGPERNGRSPETGLVLSWPPSGPPLLWQRELGEGYSMPSVAGGRLFAFDRHGDRARLTGLDAATGEELWRSEYATDYEDMYGFSNGPRASPVVDEDRVYTFGVEGRLRCHRTDDGTLLWEVDTTERFGVVQNFFGVGSTPVIEGPLLIALVGGSPEGSPGIQSGKVRGNGTGLVGFDKLTGEVRYTATDELASYSSPLVRTIDGKRVGFAFARGGLIAFVPSSGERAFRFPWRARKLESVNAATPVVVEDRVFITESYGPGGALLRVTDDGFEEIRTDPPGKNGSLLSHWATPIWHDGYLYGCSGSGSGDAELRAVEIESGAIAWSQPGLGRSTLLWADGHLIVLAEDGTLLVVEATPDRYSEVSRVALEAATEPGGRPRRLLRQPAWNAPILAHGRLYVRGKDRLVCLDLRPR